MIAASTQSNLFQSSRSAQMAWFNFLLEILRERPLLFLPSTTTLPHFAILYDVISFYRQFLPYTQCAKIFKNIRPLLSVSIKTFFSKIRTRDPIGTGSSMVKRLQFLVRDLYESRKISSMFNVT